ncbi:MAG: ABC transporter permease [Proteobacteria bacterium]|nr:ABC transporter permease [Pseudomonadota bacterium]
MLIIKLAWRNLFRNTRRTVLTGLLIGFSLTALILTDGMVLGMVEVMVGGITHTLAGEAQIHRKGFLENLNVDLYLDQPNALVDIVERDDSVSAYAPRVMAGGMFASTYNVAGGLIYGVDAVRELGVSKIKNAIIEGNYLSGSDREILIGRPMAELLEVELGDRIVITAAKVDTGEIAQELFRVTGMFEFGPRELDENIVFINLQTAQRLLAMEDKLHQIAIRFHLPEDAKNRDLALFQLLNDGEIEALGWLDFNPAIGAMLEMMNYSTLIVGAILFLLASLGVINSMFMSIYERIYEFGVAKAIGTTPRQIALLVMSEALFIGVLGCIFGAILGYGLSSYYSENGLPMGRMEVAGVVVDGNLYTKIALNQFINFPIYVILLTVVAALYPASFAARIVPSEALQRSL